MKWAYYNEWEPYCAEWLRNLIAAGHIPAGEVDERDIREVSGDDLKGYGQVHLFAGIGGWAYASRLAGIPDDESLWTGSCPCQPFSSAGQAKGLGDERHLWPAFRQLIAECKPTRIFGEQVASKDGRWWLAGVRADLEALGYAIGAADLPAAGIGAPNIRQRLWWVAHADGGHPSTEGLQRGGEHRQQPQDGGTSGLADSLGARLEGRQVEPARQERATAQRGGGTGGLGDAQSFNGKMRQQSRSCDGSQRPAGRSSPWSNFDFIPYGDGKARHVEPGTFPLAHGVPARVGKLRAYGNAIVPQVAAEFMMAARAA